MNVLVTGIDGFVGSHLAEALSTRADIHLFGTTQKPIAYHFDDLRNGIRWLQADITNPEEVRRAVLASSPDQIFHLAGQASVPQSVADPSGTFRTNVVGTLNILETLRKLREEAGNSGAVLVVSSGEVYGAVPAEKLPIDEGFALAPQNAYATTKACADLIAQQYRQSFGL